MSQGRAPSVADYRLLAKRALPKMVFDFIDGGAGSENTVVSNRKALDAKRLLASGPMNIGTRSQEVELFGRTFAMPIIIGPTGLAGAAWPKGEMDLARAAGHVNIPFVMSTGACCTQEEIASSGTGAKWMQLYLLRDRNVSARIVAGADRLGFELIEVTIDNPVVGKRMRDARNGFSVPMRWTPRKIASLMAHPRYSLRMARSGVPQLALLSKELGSRKADTVARQFHDQLDPSVDWDDVARLRDQWKKPLVVKGLHDPAHVQKALSIGVDGVVISNHGGRQLDGAAATIDVLPDFVSEAGGKLKVLINSGFRTGSDVARALALGADAVQIGRATLYALASGGEPEVINCLEGLKEELDIAQAMMGVASVKDFEPSMITDLSATAKEPALASTPVARAAP